MTLALLLLERARLVLLESRRPHQDALPDEATLPGVRHGMVFDSAGRAINAVCSPLLRLSPAFGGDRVGVDL